MPSTDRMLDAMKAYQAHCEPIKTVIIGSVDQNNEPLASYAPYVMDEHKNIYVMLSGLSPHSTNLETTARASALLIEDESHSKNLFARKRLTFSCSVDIIDPAGADFDRIADMLYDRHGTVIERMRLQPDFRIFQLSPESGRFVYGFGLAYEVCGDDFEQLRHLNAGGINPHASRNHLALEGHGRDERSSKRLPAVPRGSLDEKMKNMIVSNMNEHHHESLIKIANCFSDHGTIVEAEMMTVDSKGIGLRITNTEGSQDIRINFEQAINSAEDAQSTLMNMSMQARNEIGDS